MNAARNWVLVALVVFAAAVYFTWRVGVLNPAAPAFAWLVLGAEAMGFIRALMFLLANVRQARPRRLVTPVPGLAVDVVVPTLNESVDLLRRTLQGALEIRYPHETWILDDGARSDVRELARELGCRYSTRSSAANARAGNLNHALPWMTGEFIAIVDADEIADPLFLDRTLGYFDDPLTAFVQTPHEVLNVDSFDHWRCGRMTGHAQSAFNHLVQRGRDASGAALLCGSSCVIRRAALDEIGGFAAGTVNEDTHTGMRLHAAGWNGVFHPEVLAAGFAPFDAAAYYRQRMRYAFGAVELVREGAARGRGMTRAQARAYRLHVISNIEGWRYLAIYALPIVMLATGVLPVRTTGLAFLMHYVPYAACAWFATNVLSRGHAFVFQTAIFNLARVPASIRATLTGIRAGHPYPVTPKGHSANRRAPENAFPWLVGLASFTAIGYALGLLIEGRSSLSPDAFIVISAWAAFHVATAAQLIAHTHRCGSSRRAASRIACLLPAVIARRDDPSRVRAIRIIDGTADGCTFSWDPVSAAAPAPGLYDVRLDAAGIAFAFALEVRGRAGADRSGGALIWIDPAERAAFDLMLGRIALARLAALIDADIPHGVEVAF